MSNLQENSGSLSNKSSGIPIVYSCSGCSNLAQIAHNISLTLNGDGIAEMSCVSGVVGKVKPIIELANSGRAIIAIDGCELGCTKACPDKSELKIGHYLKISDYGIDKRDKWNDSLTENTRAIKSIYDALIKVGIGFNQ